MGIAIIVPRCDFSDANLGKVTLTGYVPVSAITINGKSTVTGSSSQYSVSYSPSNTSERRVRWSIESGNEYAVINSETGNMTILPDADNEEVVIKATSVFDNSIYATKTVTVTFSATDPIVIMDGMALVSDGTAYLNAAEYFSGAKRWNTIALNMEIVFKIYETGSDNLHIFGVSMATGSGSQKKFGFLDAVYLGGQSKLRFSGDKHNDIYSDTSNVANSLYKFSSYMAGNISIEKDGNVVFTQPTVGCDTMAQDLFPLFARITNGGSGWTTYPGAANVGIYSFKLATQVGGDVCDLVPCLYNDVPGMYDKISEKVLTTIDGGSFTLRQ